MESKKNVDVSWNHGKSKEERSSHNSNESGLPHYRVAINVFVILSLATGSSSLQIKINTDKFIHIVYFM